MAQIRVEDINRWICPIIGCPQVRSRWYILWAHIQRDHTYIAASDYDRSYQRSKSLSIAALQKGHQHASPIVAANQDTAPTRATAAVSTQAPAPPQTATATPNETPAQTNNGVVVDAITQHREQREAGEHLNPQMTLEQALSFEGNPDPTSENQYAAVDYHKPNLLPNSPQYPDIQILHPEQTHHSFYSSCQATDIGTYEKVRINPFRLNGLPVSREGRVYVFQSPERVENGSFYGIKMVLVDGNWTIVSPAGDLYREWNEDEGAFGWAVIAANDN